LKNKHNYNKLKPPKFLKTQKMKKLLALVLITSLFSACGLISETEKPAEEKQIISDESMELVDAQADNSFLNSAMSTKDKSFCEKIKNTVKKNDCMIIVSDLIQLDEALAKLDKKLCENIRLESYKTSCLSNIEIEEKEKLNELLELEKRNNEREIMNNIELEAHNKKDYSLCNKILDENIKLTCKYNVIIDIVNDTKNKSLCDEIGDIEMISICKNNF
jgi:hypothetical protein